MALYFSIRICVETENTEISDVKILSKLKIKCSYCITDRDEITYVQLPWLTGPESARVLYLPFVLYVAT